MTMRILHVLSTAERRGAQIFTADLIGAMRSAEQHHRVALIRANEGESVTFDAPTSTLGRRGSHLTLLRIDPGAVVRLRREIESWKPDVIAAHGGEPLKYAVLGGRRHRRRLVYRRIGSTHELITRSAHRRVYARLMRSAARVVTVSDAVRADTIDVFGVAPERVVAIPNGVAAARVVASRDRDGVRRALQIPPRAPVLLSVGALTWEKDPLAHLRVAELAKQRVPDLVHVLAGDGPLLGEVTSEVRRRGLEDSTRVLGDRRDVPDLLNAGDAMLIASRTEGMPGAVIEAGMVGVPVVSYALAGIPEVIQNGVTGILAPSGDAEALAAGVATVLRDPDLAARIGHAARDRCLAEFEMGAIAPRYAELFEELAAAASPTADRIRNAAGALGPGV